MASAREARASGVPARASRMNRAVWPGRAGQGVQVQDDAGQGGLGRGLRMGGALRHPGQIDPARIPGHLVQVGLQDPAGGLSDHRVGVRILHEDQEACRGGRRPARPGCQQALQGGPPRLPEGLERLGAGVLGRLEDPDPPGKVHVLLQPALPILRMFLQVGRQPRGHGQPAGSGHAFAEIRGVRPALAHPEARAGAVVQGPPGPAREACRRVLVKEVRQEFREKGPSKGVRPRPVGPQKTQPPAIEAKALGAERLRGELVDGGPGVLR